MELLNGMNLCRIAWDVITCNTVPWRWKRDMCGCGAVTFTSMGAIMCYWGVDLQGSIDVLDSEYLCHWIVL